MIGPFGPYLQLGEAGPEGEKPKRVSIPKGTDPQSVTFDHALQLLGLPRDLGPHPETGKPVKAGIGRFGPYVFHEGTYKSLRKEHNVLSVDLSTAVELLKQARTRSGPAPLKELGVHPADNQPVRLYEGRYGPYVRHGDKGTIASVPKETPLDQVDLPLALRLIADREANAPPKRGAARRTSGTKKKAAPKKDTTPKAPKKPKAAKKPTKKKKSDEEENGEA
jgi:DNA topoisomerase I